MIPTYSVAKTFTAAALMSTGVDLNAKAGDYLDVADRYQSRPIKALLRHTSGLPDYHALTEYRSAVSARESAWSVDEMLERALAVPDVSVGQFSYSNIGFALLRLVLEKATGRTFFDSLQELVFTPLDISEMAPLGNLSDWDKCALAPSDVRTYDPAWVYPGMVLATPEAMSMAFKGIFSGKLFDPRPLFETVAVNAPGHSFEEPQYGLGVMIDGDRWIAHGGGGPGFTLFTLCKQDGSNAYTSYRVGDDEGDKALIAECVKNLS